MRLHRPDILATMRWYARVLTILVLGSCTRPDPLVQKIRDTAVTQGVVTVHSPFALIPFTQSPMPGYFRVENRGEKPDTLIAVHAEGGFPEPGIHDASMSHLSALVIPAGATVAFTPGATHLMFEPPLPPVARGDSLRLTLRFARAGELVIPMYVMGYDQVDQFR